jgi:hypothetical protein
MIRTQFTKHLGARWFARSGAQAGALLSIGLLSSCATTQVTTDHDPTAPIASYDSFKLEGGKVSEDGVADPTDTLLKDRYEQALSTELQEKGLVPNEVDPDLVVRYRAGAQTRASIDDAWGEPGVWYDQMDEYTENTLVIDLIDTDTNKLVWRSKAKAEDEDELRKPEKVAKFVEEALKSYPGT